jgi:NADH dehydrogenase
MRDDCLERAFALSVEATNDEKRMHYDVVIAGGGFAGAYCARALGKALGREEGEKRVALIAERNVLVFQPMLAEVVGSSLNASDVVNPLRQFCAGVNVLQGAIQHIDWAKKEITLDGGRFTRNHVVTFNQLVVTLGSVTDLSAVPGMSDYGWPMKNVADALRLRAAIINRLEEANLVEDAESRRRLLTFVVVGGGYTGVETAGQMLDFVRDAHGFYANLRDTVPRVILVHSRGQLLAEIGAELGGYAAEVLERNGVGLRLNTRVAEVTASRVIFEDGDSIEAHTVVSTIGSAPNPVVLGLCKQLGIVAEKGRVATAPTMRVPGHDDLWIAGDCAAVPWNDRGEAKIAPPTAQLALRQGTLLGRNVVRALRGAEPLPFTYRYMGQLATIGRHEAVAEVMGFHFRGFIAWWMWRTIYLGKLPGTLRKLRVMIDWTFDLIFPRDISVLLPPPEEPLRSIHLEQGEELFARGERCRAFFYVKAGSLICESPGAEPRFLAAGSVIDQDLVAENNCWNCAIKAGESSDVIVFRGRALALLRGDLKLVKR